MNRDDTRFGSLLQANSQDPTTTSSSGGNSQNNPTTSTTFVDPNAGDNNQNNNNNKNLTATQHQQLLQLQKQYEQHQQMIVGGNFSSPENQQQNNEISRSTTMIADFDNNNTMNTNQIQHPHHTPLAALDHHHTHFFQNQQQQQQQNAFFPNLTNTSFSSSNAAPEHSHLLHTSFGAAAAAALATTDIHHHHHQHKSQDSKNAPIPFSHLPIRLLCVRHGESEANVNKSIYEQLPDHAIPLTEKGRTQARRTGRAIHEFMKAKFGTKEHANHHVRMLVSPFLRTRQTAECILEGMREAQLKDFEQEKIEKRKQKEEKEMKKKKKQEKGVSSPSPSSVSNNSNNMMCVRDTNNSTSSASPGDFNLVPQDSMLGEINSGSGAIALQNYLNAQQQQQQNILAASSNLAISGADPNMNMMNQGYSGSPLNNAQQQQEIPNTTAGSSFENRTVSEFDVFGDVTVGSTTAATTNTNTNINNNIINNLDPSSVVAAAATAIADAQTAENFSSQKQQNQQQQQQEKEKDNDDESEDEEDEEVEKKSPTFWVASVRENPMLSEQNFGAMEGKGELASRKYEEEMAVCRKKRDFLGAYYSSMPQGESFFQVCNRVSSVIHDIIGSAKSSSTTSTRALPVRTVIVVSHGVTIRAICSLWQHASPEWLSTTHNPPNCAIRVLEGAEDRGYIFGGWDKYLVKDGDSVEKFPDGIDFSGIKVGHDYASDTWYSILRRIRSRTNDDSNEENDEEEEQEEETEKEKRKTITKIDIEEEALTETIIETEKKQKLQEQEEQKQGKQKQQQQNHKSNLVVANAMATVAFDSTLSSSSSSATTSTHINPILLLRDQAASSWL